jgi:serine/threonine-protein kinase
MATTTTSLPTINGLREHDLIRLLGEGGMGKVFLARHKRTGEMVVVKTMHEHLVGEPKTRQRFQQEIDLMRRFRHPNAVAFLHASPPQVEPPFLIMEYVRGFTLDALMKEHGRLPPLRVGRLLAPLCLFLQTAHEHGLLHRDLTPANIMIAEPDTQRETIKVMDFGLARRIGFYIPSGQLDSASSAIDGGTPDYICPEQILGRQVDHRGDLYSVGVLQYGLLTGHVPFEHLSDPNEILSANVYLPPPPFAHWRIGDVPSTIERLVLSCLAKAPADRPDSARTLIEMYQLALGQPLLDEDAFAESLENSHSTLRDLERYDPRTVIDQFDATMVEQMAAIKLRGFVDGVGGRVEQSDAGVIKVSLPRVTEGVPKKVLMGWFQVRTEETDWIALELHMARKQVDTRSLVEITVTRPHAADDTIERAQARKSYCDGICCELRAYLMAGR